jgi:tRNA threonylcarbamoyladenosine biosynthesis protein TsaE
MASASGHDLVNEEATEAFARQLAALARAGDIFALSGDLGSGKSVFARAFIRARTRPDEEVPSPTFTLVQTYEDTARGVAIHHYDLYRLKAPEEALELAIEDAFADGITLIEWPERLGPLLPARRLLMQFLPGPLPPARRIVLHADAAWRDRLKGAGLAV